MTSTFRIVLTGPGRNKPKLEADGILRPSDFRKIAKAIGGCVLRARKFGLVAARRATKVEVVETYWNRKETTNRARPGDWIVTNLSPQGRLLYDKAGHVNKYVITGQRFTALYKPVGERTTGGAIYRARGEISALCLEAGFDIRAPWGERQVAQTGYLVLNGKDVYGNNKGTFDATYEVI